MNTAPDRHCQGVPKLLAGAPPMLGAYDADIVILAFNRLQATESAIRSALSQRGGTFHVTVLDQGSEAEVTSALCARFRSTRHFALYAVRKNLGVPGGRNAAAALGHGEAIICLDNDAEFKGSWVAMEAVRKLRESPDIAALGFAVLLPDGASVDLASWGYPASLLPRAGGAFDSTTFVGAGHAIRRTAWIAADGYDSDLFFCWEEYDFALRAIAHGWRIRYDGGLAVLHHSSPIARQRFGAERAKFFIRNRLVIERKWGKPRWRLVPRMLGYFVQALAQGAARPALSGILDACRQPIPQRYEMPPSGRRYLRENDRKHRGSWTDTLRHEGMRNAPSHQKPAN